jgi:hypothetical protein
MTLGVRSNSLTGSCKKNSGYRAGRLGGTFEAKCSVAAIITGEPQTSLMKFAPISFRQQVVTHRLKEMGWSVTKTPA